MISYSTTATGLDTFAAGHDGGLLSLTDGDEEYTVDELETNTNEIDTTEDGSGTAEASYNASTYSRMQMASCAQPRKRWLAVLAVSA